MTFLLSLKGSPLLRAQAGEPYQLSLVHTLQSAEHENLKPGPLHAVTETLARAARLVHPASPCIAILTKPIERRVHAAPATTSAACAKHHAFALALRFLSCPVLIQSIQAATAFLSVLAFGAWCFSADGGDVFRLA